MGHGGNKSGIRSRIGICGETDRSLRIGLGKVIKY